MKYFKNNFLIHTNFRTMTIISFILLLQKGVYPYEYMDDREKFNETLPKKKKIFTFT